MEWIDDSNFDELEVFLELESAERLLRYGLSRAFVDVTTGIMSHLAIKGLRCYVFVMFLFDLLAKRFDKQSCDCEAHDS